MDVKRENSKKKKNQKSNLTAHFHNDYRNYAICQIFVGNLSFQRKYGEIFTSNDTIEGVSKKINLSKNGVQNYSFGMFSTTYNSIIERKNLFN